ncbi:MAG: hypothetical protein ABIH41_00650 [Nanoarchaeota archaeon]
MKIHFSTQKSLHGVRDFSSEAIMQQTLDLRQFIPNPIVSGMKGNTYRTNIQSINRTYSVTYLTNVSNWAGSNVGKRRRIGSVPKEIQLNSETFEVLGLLQGEMSKTQRGPITFCNCQPTIMEQVLNWFDEEFKIASKEWHWYIKLNIPKQKDELNQVLKEELIDYWMTNTSVVYEKRFPTTLSFVNQTQNQIPKNNGTLIIERRDPVFVQTLQKLVNEVTFSMPHRSIVEIKSYMRGIIAAESCINFRPECHHRRVFITAVDDQERNIFMRCLDKLDIEYNDCKPLKDIVISRRRNIQRLHDLDLMSLNPEKHEKFLRMINSYQSSE